MRGLLPCLLLFCQAVSFFGMAAKADFISCNGEGDVFNPRFGRRLVWTPLKSFKDDFYMANLDCRYSFPIQAGKAVEVELEGYAIRGNRRNDCKNADYFQFIVDGQNSKKICGDRTGKYYLYQIGPFSKNITVQGVFHSNEKKQDWGVYVSHFPLGDKIDARIRPIPME